MISVLYCYLPDNPDMCQNLTHSAVLDHCSRGSNPHPSLTWSQIPPEHIFKLEMKIVDPVTNFVGHDDNSVIFIPMIFESPDRTPYLSCYSCCASYHGSSSSL